MKKRVLIVDDCSDTRDMFTEQFKKLGADVATSPNGRDAVCAVQGSMEDNKGFDLIILDMRMPEMSGMEAAKKIRELGFVGTVAACTASSTGEGRKAGKAAGIDIYLDKMVLNKGVFEALLNK